MRAFLGVAFLAWVNLVGAVRPAGAANEPARDPAVYAAASACKAEATDLLRSLVSIDTGTGNDKGMAQIDTLLEARLKALGATVQRVTSTPLAGDNLVATFRGTGKGKILIIAHMDTVFKAGTVAERPFKIVGNRAYGPGVNDNKGGIVAGLFAIKILKDLGFTSYDTLTFMLNTNEELGSLGSRVLIQSLARRHDLVLNLEPGWSPDRVVVARKGSAVLEVRVKGRSAHAGTAPDAGRNAALEAAHQALQLSSLADPKAQTTVNVTVITSGDRTNVIPDAAVVKADVRFLNPAEADRVERDLATLITHTLIPDVQVKASLSRTFPPMQANPGTQALFERARAIDLEQGRVLETVVSGGAADGSLTAAVGTPTLDGLGLIGGGSHSPDEFVDLDSITPRLYLLTRLLMASGGAK